MSGGGCRDGVEYDHHHHHQRSEIAQSQNHKSLVILHQPFLICDSRGRIVFFVIAEVFLGACLFKSYLKGKKEKER